MVDGVTTNPSLIAKQGKQYLETVREIAELVPGPVSGEVLATELDEILAQGRRLAAIADNVVVKVPLTPAGLRAVRVLRREGIRCNVTLCFSAGAGAARRQGRRGLHLAVHRPPRRRRRRRHGADRGDRHHLHATTTSRPRCWSPRCATRSTWCRPRMLGADVATIPFKVLGAALQAPADRHRARASSSPTGSKTGKGFDD